MQEQVLPEGWEWRRLGEISERIHYGYTASAENKKIGPKLLRITDIQDNNVDWTKVPYCQISEKDRPNYLLKFGDLVFARTGATVGKSFLIEGNIPESVFASYLIRVILEKNVDPKFIYYFFQSPFYWNQIEQKKVGAGQENVNSQKLSQIEIPLPPLPVQRQIVAMFEQADVLKRQRQKVDVLTGSLLQSVFHKMFGDPVQNEKGWEVKTVNELIDDGVIIDVQDGNHGELHPKSEDFITKGIPFITINCIEHGRVIFEKAKRLDEFWLKKLRIGFAHDGDLLLSNKGTIGKSAILKTEYDTVIVAPQITYYRIEKNSSLNSLFLFGVFQTRSFKANLERLAAAQSTRAYANLTKQKAMMIPLPPLALQQQFARIVQEVELIWEQQAESKKEIKMLFDGLMAGSFSGNLRI